MSTVDVDGRHPRHAGRVVEVGRRAPGRRPLQGRRQVFVLLRLHPPGELGQALRGRSLVEKLHVVVGRAETRETIADLKKKWVVCWCAKNLAIRPDMFFISVVLTKLQRCVSLIRVVNVSIKCRYQQLTGYLYRTVFLYNQAKAFRNNLYLFAFCSSFMGIPVTVVDARSKWLSARDIIFLERGMPE